MSLLSFCLPNWKDVATVKVLGTNVVCRLSRGILAPSKLDQPTEKKFPYLQLGQVTISPGKACSGETDGGGQVD